MQYGAPLDLSLLFSDIRGRDRRSLRSAVALTKAMVCIALAALLAISSAKVAAQAPTEEEESQLYIPLAEPLVVNYGGPGRLKYLRAEVSIRIRINSDASVIRHHMPLIRHTLVMLFSRQGEEEVNTQEGREQLRQQALAEVNEVLAQEEGRDDIAIDLLFNNFVVQR